jgi:hypothetical protein
MDGCEDINVLDQGDLIIDYSDHSIVAYLSLADCILSSKACIL